MDIARRDLHRGLQAVLDTALDAVIVMDTADRVIGWNQRAVRTFGWSEIEAVGSRRSNLIIPERYRASHERGLAHYLGTGEGPLLDRRIEVTALDRQGHELPVELSITCSQEFGDKLFVGFIRDISDRRAVAERQQRRLQESDHRVKNMLTVVSAIAQQTARNSTDLESFEESFGARLQSLAKAHELLVQSVGDEVALSVLAEQVFGADVAGGRARFGGPDLLLAARKVLGLSMILHELYTNAVKYGALCTDSGQLELDWELIDGEVVMRWSEQGQPCQGEGSSTGFGERMIALTIRSDLDGSIEREWRPEGLVATLRFPIAD